MNQLVACPVFEHPFHAPARGREALLEKLLDAEGALLALFEPSGRVLAANHPFAAALGGQPSQVEGRTPGDLGLAVGAEFEARIRWVAHQRRPSAAPALASGQEAMLTPLVDEEGAVWAVLARAERPGETAGGRFLSVASHDLRQPFQAMQLFHHLLTGKLEEGAARDLAGKLGEAINAADGMVRTLLEVATLEAGLVRPQRRLIGVDDLLANLLSEFEVKAAAKHIKLSVRPSGAAIFTDPALLARLLRHLVDNAIHCTSVGGVLIGARARGESVRLEVWDTGLGIPPGDLPALFEDFHQIAGRERRKGEGFGLALVRRLSTLLGHPVGVRSRLGRGSVFSVEVPLADPTAIVAVTDPQDEVALIG